MGKDPCERGIINLAQAKTEYTKDQQQLVKNTFSIVTKRKVYFVQTPNEKELYDWLYAINPLLAGQIRSSTGHNRPKVNRSMSRKSNLSVGGASEHVGTSHLPSNATPSAEKSGGLYDK